MFEKNFSFTLNFFLSLSFSHSLTLTLSLFLFLYRRLCLEIVCSEKKKIIKCLRLSFDFYANIALPFNIQVSVLESSTSSTLRVAFYLLVCVFVCGRRKCEQKKTIFTRNTPLILCDQGGIPFNCGLAYKVTYSVSRQRLHIFYCKFQRAKILFRFHSLTDYYCRHCGK